MSRTVTSLLFVCVIQLVAVLGLYWPKAIETGHPSEAAATLLAPAMVDEIDEVVIGDERDNEARLLRSGATWLLPDLGNLPADSAAIEKLLSTLGSGHTGWPVASSVAARQRFQVAKYHYQRRLTLSAKGREVVTIYLGTSPGFRKTHVRQGGQDAIFNIGVNVFDVPGDNGLWLDRRLLQIRTPTRIISDGYSLIREGNTWVSGTGHIPDSRELDALLSALRSLQVQGVASPDIQRDLSEAAADLVLNIQSLSGENTLELFSNDSNHFIYSSEYPMFFDLSDYDYARLTNIDRRLLDRTSD